MLLLPVLISSGRIQVSRVSHSLRSRKKRLMGTASASSHWLLASAFCSSCSRYCCRLREPRLYMWRPTRFLAPFLTLRYPCQERPRNSNSWLNSRSSMSASGYLTCAQAVVQAIVPPFIACIRVNAALLAFREVGIAVSFTRQFVLSLSFHVQAPFPHSGMRYPRCGYAHSETTPARVGGCPPVHDHPAGTDHSIAAAGWIWRRQEGWLGHWGADTLAYYGYPIRFKITLFARVSKG